MWSAFCRLRKTCPLLRLINPGILPLDSAYDEGLRSPVADLRQHAKTDDGDAPYAAAFLKHFAEGKPWAHLDIAGKELLEEDAPLARAGASGFGVLLLEEWLNGQR